MINNNMEFKQSLLFLQKKKKKRKEKKRKEKKGNINTYIIEIIFE